MYTTRLITMPCGSCTDAPSLLGKERKRSGIQEVPVVFTPIRSACSTSIVIPKGFVGLVNRHGRYVGKWEAGFKWAPPWVTISHLVPTQYVVYDTPVKECPTQDNVMVTIDVTLVLRIVTEEESIRGMTRKRKYNEIYDLMDSQQDKQMDAQRRELNDHFSQYGVVITDISVTNVHLPKEFADTMQEATVWHNRNMFKTLQQEYDLRKIEVREAEAKEKQKLKEDLEKFTAEKDKDVADVRKKKKLVDAVTQQQLAVVRENEKAD